MLIFDCVRVGQLREVFFRVRGGELFDRVADENYVLTELAVVMIICQLCEAIDYIHEQNILHLDIKVCTITISEF